MIRAKSFRILIKRNRGRAGDGLWDQLDKSFGILVDATGVPSVEQLAISN